MTDSIKIDRVYKKILIPNENRKKLLFLHYVFKTIYLFIQRKFINY
jgi:hypothetical protein